MMHTRVIRFFKDDENLLDSVNQGEMPEIKLYDLRTLEIHIDLSGAERLVCLDGNKKSQALTKHNKNFGFAKLAQSVSGVYEFFVEKGDSREPLHPCLYVHPQNITREQFQEILHDLSNIALRIQGFNREKLLLEVNPFRASQSDSVITPRLDIKDQAILNIMSSAEALEKLIEQVYSVWPRLEKHASRQLKIGSQVISRRKALKMPSGYQAVQRKPHAQSLSISMLQESFDTQENEFVVFLLDLLISKTKQLSHLFENEIQRLKKVVPYDDDSGQRVTLNFEGLPILSEQLERLARHREKLLVLKRSSFLPLHGREPLQPSQKLLHSTEYASLFRAFRRFKKQVPQLVLEKDSVFSIYDFQPTWSVSNIFEVWIFLALYETLLKFGFKPLQSGQAESFNPISIFQPNENQEKLESSGSLKLELVLDKKSLKGHQRIEVELIHEPHLNYAKKSSFRTPDILMIVKGAGRRHFIFDAKYHDNARKPSNKNRKINPSTQKHYQFSNIFFENLTYVAHDKYLQSFKYNRVQFETTASFILHSDSRPEFTFFGQGNLDDPSLPYANMCQGSDLPPIMPGHRLGSIFVLPSARENLEHLLSLCLMYHSDLYDVCWRCGKVASGQQHSNAGTNFKCDGCNAFWIKSNCSGKKKHLLVKQSPPFHKLTHSQSIWQVDCPSCGNNLDQFFEQGVQ